MHDHDLDVGAEGAGPEAAQRHDDHEAISHREIGRGVEAGRPDALGLGGLLHLQRTAGNSGVAALVAQRRAAGDDATGDGETEQPSPVHDVVRSTGSPLDPALRRDLEAATGQDYGDVRIHTDGAAASSARSVQAHAYTVGNHIVFNEGRYQPDTAEGRHTLAHELTHVVQQRQGPVDGRDAPGGIRLSDPGDRFEREAESVASRVSAGTGGDAPTPAAGAAASAVQRLDDPAEAAPVQRQPATEEEEAEAEATEPAAAAAEGAATEAAPAPEAAPGAEAAAPAPETPAEVPAEGPSEQPEEEEEATPVSKLDQGIDVQRQGEDENEDESVTQE